ncbi:hypothetical protein BDW68DRAFT_178952 [Aspergillus falconensis]
MAQEIAREATETAAHELDQGILIYEVNAGLMFVIIPQFETGTVGFHPNALKDVMALLSDNSLSIARSLLQDPIDFLSLIQNAVVPATGNFEGTSLYMSFTGGNGPGSVGPSGFRGMGAYYLETKVSLYDGGEWVAGLDV